MVVCQPHPLTAYSRQRSSANQCAPTANSACAGRDLAAVGGCWLLIHLSCSQCYRRARKPTCLRRSEVPQSQKLESLAVAGAFAIVHRRLIAAAKHLGTAGVGCCSTAECIAEVAAAELSLQCQRDSVDELAKLHLLNFELMVWRQLKQRRNQLRRHHWLMHLTLTVASGLRKLAVAAE